ncbi:MAG TPA: GNAT family N-acetyltransferase [Ktedonobacterales bacterium]
MLREPIEVRQATVDDIPFLRELMREAFLASPTLVAQYSMAEYQRYQERVWSRWREKPGPAFIAVDSAGGPIGGLRVNPDDSWAIGMGVVAAARNQGVGRRLIEAAISYARAAGAPSLFLKVDPTNAIAIALYRRMGFVETGERERAISMRLSLDEPAS